MERKVYFDFLRGIAIIMVVGIHTMPMAAIEVGGVSEWSTVLVRLVLNCAVPLFLAISGYFVARKSVDTWAQHWAFLKRQVPKVYIPCLVFSVPLLAMALLKGERNVVMNLVWFFCCGFSVYYFIALIIQYYALLPVLKRISNKIGGVITASISAISMVIVTYLAKVEGVALPLLVYAGSFPVWILFFFMGVYFSSHTRRQKPLWPLVLTVAGLVLQVAEYLYWQQQGEMALGIKLSSFAFSVGVIWLLFLENVERLYRDNMITKIIKYVGDVSFGIYLLHFHVILFFHWICQSDSWWINWLAVLLITVFLLWLAKRIMPKKAWIYFGLK